MKRAFLTLAFFAFCVAFAVAAPYDFGAAEQTSIEADSFEYSVDGKTVIGNGHVIVKRGALTVEADQVQYNQETDDYVAHGNVVASLEGAGVWKSDAVRGNAAAQTINFGPYRFDGDVWHGAGQGGQGERTGDQTLDSAWISTCDLEDPHYRLQASSVVWMQNHNFLAKNVVLKIGKVPVFWLPIMWGATDNHSSFIFKPGYSGKRGAYLQISRIWKYDNGLENKLYIDLMSKRGIGGGWKSEMHNAKRDLDVNLYLVHDRKPSETEDGWYYRFKTDNTRYRAAAYWRESLGENFTLRMNADWCSDINMMEEWFKSDYRDNNQPKSFLNLAYDNSWMNAQLNVRPRVNNYNTVVQALPELKIDIPKIEIADTGIVYDSRTSAGYYRATWRKYDMDRFLFLSREPGFPYSPSDADLFQDNDDYHSGRFDTLHTLSLPIDVAGAFTLTPHVSGRITAYSNTSRNKVSQEDLANAIESDSIYNQYNLATALGYDSKGGSRVRYAAEAGLDGRTRLYSDWMDFSWDFLRISGLRHIAVPYFNYIYASNPNVSRDNIYFFDEIDRLTKQHFLRLGLDQVWQTRRGDKVVDLATWETYFDWHFIRGEESGRYAGDAATRLALRPNDSLKLWGTFIYDCGEHETRRGEFGIRYGKESEFNFGLRYVYMKEHLSRSVYAMGTQLVDFYGEDGYIKRFFDGSETIRADVNIPLNARYSFQAEWRYDCDESEFMDHHYYLTRECHCWTWSLGCGWDDGEFETLFILRLNAMPDVKIDLNI